MIGWLDDTFHLTEQEPFITLRRGRISTRQHPSVDPISALSRESPIYGLVQPETSAGGERLQLSGIRNLFKGLGVDNALALDSGGSSALVVDQNVLANPDPWRNNTMPVGIRFEVPVQ